MSINNNNKKIGIIGHAGVSKTSLFAETLAHLAFNKEKPTVVVVAPENSREEIADKLAQIDQKIDVVTLDHLMGNKGIDFNQPIPFTALPRLHELGGYDQKVKPTCKKHHEYVDNGGWQGKVYKSKWECRHCGKKMHG